MDSLYFLIPIAILFVATAVKLFFWAVNSGQYDDLETEGQRILFDDDDPADARRQPERTEDSDNDGAGER